MLAKQCVTKGPPLTGLMAILMFQSLLWSQAYAVEVPSVTVVGVGQDALIRCNSFIALRIEWLINGTSLNSLQLGGVDQSFDSVASSGALRFRNVPVEYNGTIVQCIVHTTSGIIEAPNSTLLLQGTLSAVGALEVSSINDSAIFLNWTAPFTLDISFSSIDIRYCVDVVSSTSSATLHSECRITETEFTYSLPPMSWCHEYNITVTPQNVVGNGTVMSMTYISQALSIPDRTVQVIRYGSVFTIVMSAPVCTASLTCIDLDDAKGTIRIESADLNITEARVAFTALQLNPNRRYAITITASNVRGTAEISELHQQISTHNIQDATFTEEGDTINIEISYFDHSVESGALLIFKHLEPSDTPQNIYLTLHNSISLLNYTLPFSLRGGRYRVFVYDIESDGALATGVGYPAVSHEVSINTTVLGVSELLSYYRLLKKCVITTFGYVTVVECTYSMNSLAMGFQVIVQQIDSSETGKLYLHQTRNQQTKASVVMEENGLFRVSVIAIRRQGGIINSNIEYTEQIVINSPTSATNPATTTTTSNTPTNNTIGLVAGLGLLSIVSVMLTSIVVIQFILLYIKRSKIWPKLSQALLMHRPCQETEIQQLVISEPVKKGKIPLKSLSNNRAALLLLRCKLDHMKNHPAEELHARTLNSHDQADPQLPEDSRGTMPVTTAPASLVDPQYEEVADYVRKKSEDYKVTVCAAYGLPLNS